MRSLDREIKKSDDILFIDGYNIINSWNDLKELDSLEEARRRLVHKISEYQAYINHLVVLVFDSYKTKRDRQININAGLAIVYTKERETADHFIEEMVEIYGRKKNIKVATSDRVEQDIILARGATRMSAKEFEIQVNSARDNIKDVQQQEKIRNELHLSGLNDENQKLLLSLITDNIDKKVN